MSKRRAGTSAVGEPEEVETELIARVSPLMVLCNSRSGVSVVILLPTAFDVSRGKGLDSVSLSELHEEKAFVHGNVLRPSSISSSDDGRLYFKSTMCGELIKAGGTTVQPCSPTMAMGSNGTPTWEFPIFSLTILHTLQWGEWTGGRRGLSMVKEPYTDRSSTAIFIIEGTESEGLPMSDAPPAASDVPPAALAATKAAATRAANARSVTCPLCLKSSISARLSAQSSTISVRRAARPLISPALTGR